MRLPILTRLSPTRCIVLLALAVAIPACCVTKPNLTSPGTIEQQRFRSVMFDPYSDVDIGPEVVGGRPREFQRPLSQVDRNELVDRETTPFFPSR